MNENKKTWSLNYGGREVTIETGTKIKVPLFIKEGEVIKINTDDGSYVSKA